MSPPIAIRPNDPGTTLASLRPAARTKRTFAARFRVIETTIAIRSAPPPSGSRKTVDTPVGSRPSTTIRRLCDGRGKDAARPVMGIAGAGRHGGQRPRTIRDEGTTQHDIFQARLAERAKRTHQRGSVREPLELKRMCTPQKRLTDRRIDQREDAWRRLLRAASEMECFKELGDGRLVLGVGVHDDDFGPGFA